MALSSQRRRQGAWPLSFYPAQGGIFQRGVSEALGARWPSGEHVRPHVGR